MAAPARHDVILPTGETAVLTKDGGDSFSAYFHDDDGSPRDISGDTQTAVAKLGVTSKTLTLAAVSPQTGRDKGRCVLTIPAAQLDAAGTLVVDLKNQISGEEAKIFDKWQFTVEDSDAD